MSDEKKLIEQINANLDTGKLSKAVLATDDRVLARITDGIYRQPGSALRELIANAYDADAQNVYVQTDAPRFSKISVRDDGMGLTIEALASLIHHIGGSPKRTQSGVELGVANKDDPSLSPGGRRLVGKIGIGLFSVSQLTRHFQIITKTKGSSHTLTAEVTLKTYTEDDLAKLPATETVKFETGDVRIRATPAAKKSAHGTEIVLMDLRPQTRELLQSRDIWRRVDAASAPGGLGETRQPPKYHIGRLKPEDSDIILVSENLPWKNSDAPDRKFAKLYQAIVDAVDVEESNPKLETLLDDYLRMLWTLSLSAPIDYIEGHPFDLRKRDDPLMYQLSNQAKGQATQLTLKKEETVRERLGLVAPERGATTPFRIFVDEVELRRPIRFNRLPTTSQAIKKPLMFFGKCEPNLKTVPDEIRGGDLSFEGYFLWTPKVVPKENNGLLVRISDASGTLFDESFIKYQISEQTRLRQITAEIFVLKGLDAALNIDRESFNYSHPHYQYLMKWVHNGLRQLANTHKQVASDLRVEKRRVQQTQRMAALTAKVEKALKQVGVDVEEDIPEVILLSGKSAELTAKRKEGVLAFDSDVIFEDVPEQFRATPANKARREYLEEKTRAVAKILEAYGVFENMRYAKQQELLRAIVAVFASEE